MSIMCTNSQIPCVHILCVTCECIPILPCSFRQVLNRGIVSVLGINWKANAHYGRIVKKGGVI